MTAASTALDKSVFDRDGIAWPIVALQKEAADLRQALEDRKLVERAKGILMRLTGLGEEEAFRRLQKLASDKNRKLIDIARLIVDLENDSDGRPAGDQQSKDG